MSGILDTLKQGAGAGLSALDLLSAAGHGNLGRNLYGRQLALQDPAIRESVGPFMAGFLGTYGGREPISDPAELARAGLPPEGIPGVEVLGQQNENLPTQAQAGTYNPVTEARTLSGARGSRFVANLPPLGETAQIAQEAKRLGLQKQYGDIALLGPRARYLASQGRLADVQANAAEQFERDVAAMSRGEAPGAIPGEAPGVGTGTVLAPGAPRTLQRTTAPGRFMVKGYGRTPTGGSLTYGYPEPTKVGHGFRGQLDPGHYAVEEPHPLAKDAEKIAAGRELYGANFDPANPTPEQEAVISRHIESRKLAAKRSEQGQNQLVQIRAAREGLRNISAPMTKPSGAPLVDRSGQPVTPLSGLTQSGVVAYTGQAGRLANVRQYDPLGIATGLGLTDPTTKKAITRLRQYAGTAVTIIKAFGDTANAAVAEQEVARGALIPNLDTDTQDIAREKVRFLDQILTGLEAEISRRQGGGLSDQEAATIIRRVAQGGIVGGGPLLPANPEVPGGASAIPNAPSTQPQTTGTLSSGIPWRFEE